jgi:MoaA/NifB/PqqE/SkfB family radical SAM enzyme
MLDGAHAVYGGGNAAVMAALAESQALAAELGVSLRGAGATDALHSLETRREARPWAACLRPWTTAYITANGNALPCCIAPFATTDYASLQLGNIFETGFDQLWNAVPYQDWRRRLLDGEPPAACAGCGVFWSL